MFCLECNLPVDKLDSFTCRQCNKITHQKCNMYTLEEIALLNITMCDMCRLDQGSSPCCICNERNGWMKRCEYNHYNKWVHKKCLTNGNEFKIKDGYYKAEFCDKKDCKLCSRQDIFFIDEVEDEVNIISTLIKCEICFKDIRKLNEVLQCKSCFSLVHDYCEKNFYSRTYIESKGICAKCTILPKIIPCIICQRQGGFMILCGKSFAHLICIFSFPLLVQRRRGNGRSYEIIRASIKEYHHSKCCLCDREGENIIQCNKCHIQFHPYCGFKVNFTICFINSNSIEFKCNEKHLLYCSKEDYNLIDIEHYSPSSSLKTTAMSVIQNTKKGIDEFHNNNCAHDKNKLQLRQQYDVLNDNLTFKFGNNKQNSNQIKQIKKFKRNNNIHKEKNMIKNKKQKTNILSKEDIQSKKIYKFNWRLTDKYFKKITKDKVINTFPYAYHNDEEIAQYLQVLLPKTSKSPSKNDTINESDYFICNIKKRQSSSYIVYKMKTISGKNTPPSTENTNHISYHDNSNNNLKLLSHKRKASKEETISSSSSFSSLQMEAIFIRAFKLNPLSNHMLIYEKQSSEILHINEDYSYLMKQIEMKKCMLKQVILTNLSLSKNIPSTTIQKTLFHNYEIQPNELMTEMSSAKNIAAFKTMMKRLSEGLRDKRYESLFYGDGTNKSFTFIDIQDTKEYYENDSECSICFAYCLYSSTQIIYCDQCNVSVHLNCYGIKRLPYDSFKCDLCNKVEITRYQDIKCVFCLQSRGAMKKIPKGCWAHVNCILVSKYAGFVDYYTLNKAYWFKENIGICGKETNILCGICRKKEGEKFECLICKLQYHFSCAYFAGFQMKLINKSKISYNISSITTTTTNAIMAKMNKKNNDFIEKNAIVYILHCSKDYDINWDINNQKLQASLRKMVYQKSMTYKSLS